MLNVLGSEALDGAYVSTYISRGRGDIVLDHVECGGSERMIRECRISAQITCDHSNDAGVRCSHRGEAILTCYMYIFQVFLLRL